MSWWKAKPRMIEVSFVNGPLDGLRQYFLERELKPAIAFPVSPKLFQLIRGIDDATSSRPTSIAFYERHVEAAGINYVFAGSQAPDAVTL